MTPLQGALIAAAIANNGVQMRPYLIDTLQGSDLTPLVRAEPSGAAYAGRRRTWPRSCASMMDGVVTSGTGTKAKIDGYEVGGKTGTAQNGDRARSWLVHRVRPQQGRPARSSRSRCCCRTRAAAAAVRPPASPVRS